MNFYEHRVFNFSKKVPSVIEDISLYKQLNCSYGIIHLTSRSEALKSERYIYGQGLQQLKLVDKIGKDMGFEFYLENVHQSLDFYKRMLEDARKLRLTNIHFCFDLGHAKVYSPIDGTTITDWVLWLKTLRKVHFHLHNNWGRKSLKTPHWKLDKHMPFGNNTEGDDFSEGVEYVNLVHQLENEFPESKKVFEVKPNFGLNNMRTILDLPKEAKLL
jgi:sugar phosphate isomerase/epimerase